MLSCDHRQADRQTYSLLLYSPPSNVFIAEILPDLIIFTSVMSDGWIQIVLIDNKISHMAAAFLKTKLNIIYWSVLKTIPLMLIKIHTSADSMSMRTMEDKMHWSYLKYHTKNLNLNPNIYQLYFTPSNKKHKITFQQWLIKIKPIDSLPIKHINQNSQQPLQRISRNMINIKRVENYWPFFILLT